MNDKVQIFEEVTVSLQVSFVHPILYRIVMLYIRHTTEKLISKKQIRFQFLFTGSLPKFTPSLPEVIGELSARMKGG